MREYRKRSRIWNLPRSFHLFGGGSWMKRNFFLSRILRFLRTGNLFTDYEDNDEEYLLKIEVPGVERDKISAKASSDTLTVEIEGDPYFYSIPVNVNPEKVYATLKLGILTIHLPKKEPDRNVDID